MRKLDKSANTITMVTPTPFDENQNREPRFVTWNGKTGQVIYRYKDTNKIMSVYPMSNTVLSVLSPSRRLSAIKDPF